MTAQTTTPRPQAPGEPPHLYALELLRHAIAQGVSTLTLDQLKQADRFYPLAIHGLSKDDARQVDQLTIIRHRIIRTIDEREKMIAQWFQEHAQDDAEQLEPIDQAGEQLEPEPTPAEQATRLMRAALLLIMDQRQDDGIGGVRVPRTPIPPRMPPGGAHATPDATPTTRPTRTAPTPPAAPQPPQIVF